MLWVIQTADGRSFWNDPRRQWSVSLYSATHFRSEQSAYTAYAKRRRQKLVDSGEIVPYELTPCPGDPRQGV